MTPALRFGAFLLLALCPATVRADPFTILPNGDPLFNVVVRTTGTFTCFSSFVSCSGSGTNTMTLMNGAETTTLVFSGVTTTAQVGGHARIPILLGQVDATSSDGFTFPSARHPAVPVFTFRLTIEHTSPVADTQSIGWGFGRPQGTTIFPITEGGDWLNFPIGENPPGFNYRGLLYDFPDRLALRASGTTDITATLGAIPEPGTLVLLGTGVFGMLIRKRTRARQSPARHHL